MSVHAPASLRGKPVVIGLSYPRGFGEACRLLLSGVGRREAIPLSAEDARGLADVLHHDGPDTAIACRRDEDFFITLAGLELKLVDGPLCTNLYTGLYSRAGHLLPISGEIDDVPRQRIVLTQAEADRLGLWPGEWTGTPVQRTHGSDDQVVVVVEILNDAGAPLGRIARVLPPTSNKVLL